MLTVEGIPRFLVACVFMLWETDFWPAVWRSGDVDTRLLMEGLRLRLSKECFGLPVGFRDFRFLFSFL